MHYAELTGLNPLEIERPADKPLQNLWIRGGFPTSYSAADDGESCAWQQHLIRTDLEREIPQLQQHSCAFGRCWLMDKANSSTRPRWPVF